jgi:hypothetical protein
MGRSVTAAFAPFFNTILPIFVVPALGFLFGWRGVFTREAAAGVNRFVFFVANPALLFGILSEAPLTEFRWSLIVLYMASVAIIYPLGYLMARRLFRRSREEALLLGMACCFPNHVLFVLPIVTELYGPGARPPLASIITVDSLLVFSMTLYLMDMLRSAAPSPLRTLGLQLRNPMTLSILLGILVNLSGIEIHQGLRTYVNFAGAATAPGALFALGVILSHCDWKRVHAATLAIVGTKLIIHPALAFLFFGAAGALWTDWSTPVLLTAAGPCGAMPFVIALQYGVPTDTIAKAILLSTILSVFTLSALA